MTGTTIETEEFKMTELGPIPCDWEIGMLGSGRYFQILPSGIDNFTGQKKYLSTSSIQGWQIESPECPIYYGNRPSRANMQPRLNTVWFAKMIGTVKVYCFTESNREEVTEYILSTGFCGIRCKEDVDTEYLKFIFLSDYFNTLKDSLCSGTTQRAINNESVSAIQVPLPPLPEQKKIAYVLSTVQTAIEKTEAVIKAARALKKSLMKHLFTYGPVSIEQAESVLLKETEIGLVPEGWEVVRLESLAEIKYGKANPKDSGETPVVGSGGIYSYTANPIVEFPTIIIGRKGTAGRVWLFESPCYPSDTTFYLRWKAEIDVPFLFSYMLLNPLSGQHAKTTLPSLQKPDLEKMFVPFPPLTIQRNISNLIGTLDRKIDAEQDRKKALEELFKTLLSNLMTGKIRVNSLEVPV